MSYSLSISGVKMVDKILLMFVAGVLLAFIRWAVVGIVKAIRGKDV